MTRSLSKHDQGSTEATIRNPLKRLNSTLRVLRDTERLLSGEHRGKTTLVFFSIIVTAVFEVVGIVSVVPFLAAVGNPNVAQDSGWMGTIHALLGEPDRMFFLVLLGVASIVLIVITNAVRLAGEWILLQYTFKREHELSVQLLEGYLYRPYVYFLTQNTADLCKNILGEVNQVVSGVLIAGMNVVARMITTLLLVVLLVVASPTVALGTAVIAGGGYLISYRLARRKLRRLGQERIGLVSSRYRLASEALKGIKELKIFGVEPSYLEQYSKASSNLATVRAQKKTMVLIPGYILQVLIFSGLIGIVIGLLLSQGSIGEILPTVGFFAFAGLRLLPNLQGLFKSMAQVRFCAPVVKTIGADLRSAMERRAPVRGSEHLRVDDAPFEYVEFEAVSFAYPGQAGTALKDLTLEIRCGEKIGVAGVTGCGKTTFINLLLGLLQPTSGVIRVDGSVLSPESVRAWWKRVGYVPQDVFLLDGTLLGNIAFGVPEDEISLEHVARAAEGAQIARFVEGSLPDGYRTPIGEQGIRLSGGQRQRVGIARALYRCPQILVFDEGTSALDSATERAVMDGLFSGTRTRTAVLVAHRLTTLEPCDRILFFDSGRLVDHGTYGELLSRNAAFRRLAGRREQETEAQDSVESAVG